MWWDSTPRSHARKGVALATDWRWERSGSRHGTSFRTRAPTGGRPKSVDGHAAALSVHCQGCGQPRQDRSGLCVLCGQEKASLWTSSSFNVRSEGDLSEDRYRLTEVSRRMRWHPSQPRDSAQAPGIGMNVLSVDMRTSRGISPCSRLYRWVPRFTSGGLTDPGQHTGDPESGHPGFAISRPGVPGWPWWHPHQRHLTAVPAVTKRPTWVTRRPSG